MTLSDKVAHVKRARQTRIHNCHWPGCTKQIPPAKWGCKLHWFKLPKHLREQVWAAYRIGQEIDCHPSQRYMKLMEEVQEWIRGEMS